MAHTFPPDAIAAYAEKVYQQMHGLFAAENIPGIRDESVEGGFVGIHLDEIYAARLTLTNRYSIPEEDPDLLRIITAYDALLKSSAIAMFQHGMNCAVRSIDQTKGTGAL